MYNYSELKNLSENSHLLFLNKRLIVNSYWLLHICLFFSFLHWFNQMGVLPLQRDPDFIYTDPSLQLYIYFNAAMQVLVFLGNDRIVWWHALTSDQWTHWDIFRLREELQTLQIYFKGGSLTVLTVMNVGGQFNSVLADLKIQRRFLADAWNVRWRNYCVERKMNLNVKCVKVW